MAIFDLLIEATVKGTVVLAAAAVLALALHRASAAYRHVVWACAFCAVLLLPALLSLPALKVQSPALAWLQPVSRPQSLAVQSRISASEISVQVLQSPSSPAGDVASPTPSPLASQPTPAAPSAPTRPTAIPWPAIAITLWAMGALAVLAVFLAGYLRVRRLLLDAEPVRDEEWNALAKEATDTLRLATPFTLLHGEGLPVPVAMGILRPRVLLPAVSNSWPLELRRAVLLHELAHIKRHDCLTQAIGQVACAIFWFHPALWWAASQMRTERERACDDCVLIARTRASEYAEHLLGVVRSLRARGPEVMGAVAFARPSSLEGRLLAVLDPARDRRAAGLRVAAAGAIAAALLVAPLAALEPVQAYTVRIANKSPRHEKSDPNALKPSRIVAVPEVPRSIEERAAWARAEADRAREREWWIGWRIDVSPTLKGNLLSDTEGISLWLLDQPGLFTLDDLLQGRKQGTSNRHKSIDAGEGTSRPTAVLVRMSGGTGDRLRVQSLSLPADFEGQPLYWMDGVSDEQSVAWLRGFADRAREEHLRRQVVESLGFTRRSDLVTPYLTSTLEGSGPDQVRAGAAEGLGHHPSSDIVRVLAGHARKDRSLEVRRASIEALGQLQTPEALEELLAIARASEGDAGARRAAFDALSDKVSDRAHEKADPGRIKAKGRVVIEEKSGAWDPEQGEDPEDDPDSPDHADEGSLPMPAAELEVQRQAIESLGRYPEAQSLPRLRRIAETSPNGQLRAQAVESIGRLGTPASIEVLEQVVWKNRQSDARRSAVEALGRRLPADRSLEKLSAIARTHPSPDTRREAVEMLGRMDSPRSLNLLREIVVKGADVESQRQAVESLGRHDDPGVEAQLLEIARTHRSVDVRRQAVESLGRREGKEIPASCSRSPRGKVRKRSSARPWRAWAGSMRTSWASWPRLPARIPRAVSGTRRWSR